MEEKNVSRIDEEEQDEQSIEDNRTDENRPDERNVEDEDEDEANRKGMVGAYSLDDADFLEASESEYLSKYGKKWEEGRDEEALESTFSGAIDWEKQAKETMHLDTTVLSERRRTIFELDSYTSAGPSVSDILKIASKDYLSEQPKEIRYSVSLGAPGIARINLSPLTQKVIGCVIGENVSTEYPWVYVKKEIIEDNIDLHEDSSDFLPIKDEIRKFSNSMMLIGYVPSLTEEGQFYICLTEEGRDVVVEHIQKQRQEHENRVRTAIYKPLGQWADLGSGLEIQSTIVRNTRPLLEIEVVATADVLNAPMHLEDRQVKDANDGYIELLPYRQVYEIIPRRVMYKATQVTPAIKEMEIQTILSVPINTWVQYEYTYQLSDIKDFNEEQLESLRNFLHHFTDSVCDILLLNATFDMYTNDYSNLVMNIRDTQWPIPVSYVEHLSFHDEKHVVDKVINDLCWHPLWSGISFAAYTSYAKSQHLDGPKTDKEVVKDCANNFVLAWSFNDCLGPKLVLESPREVTSVAINPVDGHLVIVLWHIPDKIELVETVEVDTPAQIKHRTAIRSLITWMLITGGISTVKPTAMSSLKDSHKAAITQIIWVSPFDMLDRNGRFTSLPEDTSVGDLSSQFITASEDGTIAFWDLKMVDRLATYQVAHSRKKKAQTKRPETLTKSISPLKKLDRIFKPSYMLVVHHPTESRNIVITTITVYVPKFKKERVDLLPETEDLTIRRYFRNIIQKPDIVMQPKIYVGTVEGDFGCVAWDGYDFATDLAVNTEVCHWTWCKKVHDGPITHSVRCRFDDALIATIGGKIFAIWKEDLGTPLIWKKSDVEFTALSWGSFRPTVLIMTRMDGSVELWDFMIKSDEPCVTQSLSGRIITGIYTHELIVNPQCVGFCDFNGILRMFLAPSMFRTMDQTTIEWMENFMNRQIERIQNSKAWKEVWMQTKYKDIEEKQRLAKDAEKKKQMEEQETAARKVVEVESSLEPQKRSLKPSEMMEQARERWKERELKHMQQVILEKKGLKKDDLEKQREPILKLKQEAERKKTRLKEAMQMQENIFKHTKSLFFPKKETKVKEPSLQITSVVKEDLVTEEDTILAQEVQGLAPLDPNEEIIYHFMETQTKVLDELQKNRFEHSFDWKAILMKGKSRRHSMDYELRKLNKTKRMNSLLV